MVGSVLEDTMKRLGNVVNDVIITGLAAALVMVLVLWVLRDFLMPTYDGATGLPMFLTTLIVTSIVASLVTIGRILRLEQREHELELAHKLLRDIGNVTVHATLKRCAHDVQEAYVAYDEERQRQSSADEPHPESDAIKNLRHEHYSRLKQFEDRQKSARLAGIPAYNTIADTLANELLARDLPQAAEASNTDASPEVVAEAARV